jgi:hypothetical protein
VNVLDENVLASQRSLLRRRRIPFRQNGFELGRKGMTDGENLSLLHGLGRPTFIPRDADFSNPGLGHARYCLVWVHVGLLEVAAYIQRLLRQSVCDTQASRMGAVMNISPTGFTIWRGRFRGTSAMAQAQTKVGTDRGHYPGFPAVDGFGRHDPGIFQAPRTWLRLLRSM